MTGAPAVSVIIPFRNAAPTLAATLDSLCAQTFANWEAWLIDDASTDAGPAMVAARAGRDARLRLIRAGVRQGVAGARNLGIRASRGRIIAFLDADDLWRPDKLARQMTVIGAMAPIVFSSYRRIDAEGRPLGTVRARARVDYRAALGGNPIGCLTAMFDTATFGRAEMPPVPMHEDYAFWLGLLRGGGAAVGIDTVLADYRVRPGSASADKRAALAATWGILRGQEGLGPLRAGWGFARYVAGALARRV